MAVQYEHNTDSLLDEVNGDAWIAQHWANSVSESPFNLSDRIKQDSRKLTIVSNPLFGSMDCFVSVEDILVEHIRISARKEGSGFDLCEVWRGSCRPVQGSVVAFSYSQLLETLRQNCEVANGDDLQQRLLALLEHDYFCQLNYRGYGIYTILSLSHLASMDYPFVYLLALLGNRHWQRALSLGVITRDRLASALDVAQLSNGQMKALRKLVVSSSCSEKNLYEAMRFIAQQWDVCRPLVSHKEVICPTNLNAAKLLYSMQPELVKARWFTLDQLALWVNQYSLQWQPRPNEYDDVDIQQSVCVLFLFGKVLVHVTGEADQLCDAASVRRNTHQLMQWQDVASVDRRAMQLLTDSLRAFQRMDDDPAHFFGFFAFFIGEWITTLSGDFPLSLRDSVMDAWYVVLERIRGQLNDELYNHEQSSLQYADDVPLLQLSGIAGDGQFSLITTAGHLREIASLLRNCAAGRVHAAVQGNAEFWMYRNDITRETALLQIDRISDESRELTVVEFNGFSNGGVSKTAQQHLADWLTRQEIVCYNPYSS